MVTLVAVRESGILPVGRLDCSVTAACIWRRGWDSEPKGALRTRKLLKTRFARVGRFAPLTVWRDKIGYRVRTVLRRNRHSTERLPAASVHDYILGSSVSCRASTGPTRNRFPKQQRRRQGSQRR